MMGTIEGACATVGITRTAIRNWRKRDLDFAEAFEGANEAFADTMEAIAYDRVQDPKGNRGSDALLSHILNAHRPQKWKPELKVQVDTTRDILNAIQGLVSRSQAIPAKAEVIEGQITEGSDGGSDG